MTHVTISGAWHIPVGASRLRHSGDQPWQTAPAGLHLEVDEPRGHASALRVVGEPGRRRPSGQASSNHTFVDLAEHQGVAHEAAAALGDLARDIVVPTPRKGDDRGIHGRPGVDGDIAVAKISNSSIERSRHCAITLEPPDRNPTHTGPFSLSSLIDRYTSIPSAQAAILSDRGRSTITAGAWEFLCPAQRKQRSVPAPED